MNNLTKIAALPTGGGCQSALRPEDRGAERKPRMERLQLCGGFMEVLAAPGEQVEAVSVEPGEGQCLGVWPTLTLNFGGPPDGTGARKVWPEKCRADLKGGGA